MRPRTAEHGSGEDVALHEANPEILDSGQFCAGFHAFADRYDTEIAEHGESVLEDDLSGSINVDAAYQVHIDLHDVGLKSCQ